MSVEVLLSRLEGVQRSGKGWRARCPACAGRSRKLSVSEGDEGRVLLHCFAGCAAAEVLGAAGLELADLFPERIPDALMTREDRERRQRLAREAQWGAALEVLSHEATVVAVAAREFVNGRTPDEADAKRLQVAMQRIGEAESILSDRPAQRWKEFCSAQGKAFAERAIA